MTGWIVAGILTIPAIFGGLVIYAMKQGKDARKD